MNRDCELRIYTSASQDGGEDDDPKAMVTQAAAKYYLKKKKHYILFDVDNDKCHIEFDDKGLLYRRQGALSYEMQLSSGYSSSMNMKTAYGQVQTDYMVYHYDTDITEDRMEVSTDYRSAGEEYHLRIVIEERNKGV